MNTQAISIDFPADILLALNETENELKQRIKTALAIQLYKLQKLTIGKAAQISGLSRLQFETILSENEVPISNLTRGDVIDDIEKLTKKEKRGQARIILPTPNIRMALRKKKKGARKKGPGSNYFADPKHPS